MLRFLCFRRNEYLYIDITQRDGTYKKLLEWLYKEWDLIGL